MKLNFIIAIAIISLLLYSCLTPPNRYDDVNKCPTKIRGRVIIRSECK